MSGEGETGRIDQRCECQVPVDSTCLADLFWRAQRGSVCVAIPRAVVVRLQHLLTPFFAPTAKPSSRLPAPHSGLDGPAAFQTGPFGAKMKEKRPGLRR